jgi:hypothetical protein
MREKERERERNQRRERERENDQRGILGVNIAAQKRSSSLPRKN